MAGGISLLGRFDCLSTSWRRRTLTAIAAVVGLQAVDPAAAHAGTTHAGTPHWLLLVATLAGAVGVVGGWATIQDDETSTRFGTGLVVGGVLVTIFGAVGLVEIQVVPRAAPTWTRWFPVINTVAAIVVALGGLVVGFLRYPERPRYVGLTTLLAAWIVYPVAMPNEGLSHPFGYLLALAVPFAVAYVLYRDAGDAVPAAVAGRVPKLVGAAAFALFGAFFAFSAGTLSVSPDTTPDIAGEGFVTLQRVAAPLVYWPAVEFYAPQIPVSGYVSLGTVLLAGLLGGLVALNASLVARQVAAGGADSPRAMVGAVTTAGATACCCCAPAVYGAVGVLFGAAASPVYWAFMDPTSPVGGLFLAASVLVLTGSAIRASQDPACRVPLDREAASPAEQTA